MIRAGEIGRKLGVLALTLAASLLTALCLASPASAGLAYTKAQPLSPRGEPYSTGGPSIVIDGSDRATVAWLRDDELEFAQIAPDGTPGPVRTVDDAAYSPPVLTVDRAGTVTILWTGATDTTSMIRMMRVSADGTAGPVQTISDPAVNSQSPDAVVDDSGRVTVVWSTYDYSGPAPEMTVRMAHITASGVAGPSQQVSEHAGYGAPQVALGPSGAAMVAWSREARVLARWVAPDGTPGKLLTLAANRDYNPVTGVDLVADSSGRFTAAWGSEGGGVSRQIETQRFAADGTPGPVHSIPTVEGQYPRQPQLVIDGDDRITLIWAVCVSNDCGGRFGTPRYEILRSRLGEDGVPGPRLAISHRTLSGYPALTVDGLGRITAVWDRLTEDGLGAVRLTPDGTPGEVLPASRPSLRLTYSPSVAADSTGRTTVVWANGEENRIEFSRSYFDARLRGKVSAKRRQRQAPDKVRIAVRVKAGEPLAFNARGRIAMKGRDYAVKLKREPVPGDTTTEISLRPNWRDRRIAGRIQRGKKAVAKLEVRIRDHAGNAKEKRFRVRLIP